MSAGVLALQGDVEPHLRALEHAGASPRTVRRPEDLEGLTHLVLPGGESTTIHHLLHLFDLERPIVERHRAGELCLFGTCAGAILLGRESAERPPRLGLLDVEVERNGYGRQVDSFTRELAYEDGELRAVFIRAPRFRSVGANARVLATLEGEPVLVEGNGCLAATFHPELTDDLRVHRRFLEMSG